MEMKDNASAGILEMQTNILEEIREIRRRDEMRYNMEQMKAGTSPLVNMDAGVISPVSGSSPNDPYALAELASGSYQNDSVRNSIFNGEDHYQPLSATVPPPPSNIDTSLFPGIDESPLSYASVSELSQYQLEEQDIKKQLRELTAKQYEGFRNTGASIIEDFTGLDTMSMSTEDISKHLARRSHGIERLSGDVMTGALGIGGTAASLFMPLGSGLLVGGAAAYGTKEIASGAKTALDLQDILLEDGHKAFNVFQSTGDYGALGIGREDRQDISKEIRHLAVDEFLEDDEITSLLQGSLDYKLLRSTQDSETFKNKFAEIVKTTKHVAATLGTSLEEAQVFIDEFNRKGISLDDMKNLTAQGKIGASFTGEDAEDFISRNLEISSALTQGTSIDSGEIMKSLGYSTSMISSIESRAEEEDPELFRYIKNMGGMDKIPGIIEQEKMEYLKGEGTTNALALYGDAFTLDETGHWKFDSEKFQEILASGDTVQERRDKSAAHQRSFSTTDLERLTREASDRLYNDLTETERSQLIRGINEQYQQITGLDEAEAYYHMGLTNEESREALKLRELMYTVGADGSATSQFDNLALQEQFDTAYRQERPGLVKRGKFAIKRAFGLPLGDVGQYATQKVGDFTKKNINDRLNEMTDKERSDLLEGRTLSREERLENAEELTKHLEDAGIEVDEKDFTFDEEDEEDYGLESGKTLTRGTYNQLIDKAKDQTLSFEELEQLEEDKGWGSGSSLIRKAQSYAIRSEATGEGNPLLKAGSKLVAWGGTFFNNVDKTSTWGGGSPTKDLEKQQKKLTKEFEKKEKKFRKTLMKDKTMSNEDKDELWELVQAYKEGEDVDLDDIDVSMSDDVRSQYEDLSDILEKSTAAKKAEEVISADTLSVQIAMDSSANMYQLLRASGAITEEEYATHYMRDEKDLRNRIKSEKKKLSKMNVGQREKTADKYKNLAIEALEKSGEEGMLATAEMLVEHSPELDLEDFYVDGEISAEKIYESSFDIARSSYEGTSKVDEILGDGSPLNKSVEGLEVATGQVAAAIENNNESLKELAQKTEENFSIVYDVLNSLEHTKDDFVTSRMG